MREGEKSRNKKLEIFEEFVISILKKITNSVGIWNFFIIPSPTPFTIMESILVIDYDNQKKERLPSLFF